MKKVLSLLICLLLCVVLCSCSSAPKEKYESRCSLKIECSSVLDNTDKLNKDKLGVIPENGIVINIESVGFNDGETVYDVLQRVCRENKIHLDASITPAFNTAYVKGINNLYEFDCGEFSGWIYSVNGDYPNFGCSDYKLSQGDEILFSYTCEFSNEF